MDKAQISLKNQKNVSIGQSHNGCGLTHLTVRDIKKGEVVMSGFGKIIDHQTEHISIQIGRDKHYLPTKWTGRYWNHSCEPITFVRTRRDGFPDLVALRNIKKGDEINYSYWMTEFVWSKAADENNIKCLCGTKRCRGKIDSFADLPKKVQIKVKNDKLCSKYLCKLS